MEQHLIALFSTYDLGSVLQEEKRRIEAEGVY